MLKPRTMELLREDRLKLLDAVAHIDYLLDFAESNGAAQREKFVDTRKSHHVPTGRPRGRQSKYDWVLGQKMFENENKKVKDIADRLGCSVSAVKGRIMRCKWERSVVVGSLGKTVVCSDCSKTTAEDPCQHCHIKLPTSLAMKLK